MKVDLGVTSSMNTLLLFTSIKKCHINTCCPPVDTGTSSGHAGTNKEVKGQSSNDKPWLEESTLSSQCAADSTGRDDVREKEHKRESQSDENNPG